MDDQPGRFLWRCVAAHTATYMLAGLVASSVLDYSAWWATPEMAHYTPMDSAWVAAGPAIQVVRGLVIGLALLPFRDTILDKPHGWLRLWALLFAIGVVSTYGPSPGSIEGWVYLDLPLAWHLFGLPEVLVQTLAFSGVLALWYGPWSRAVGRSVSVVFVLALAASLAGVVAAGH